MVISNLYPPYYIGGYELGCRDVVDGLKERGYRLRVLTSSYGVKGREQDGEVYRWLKADFRQLGLSSLIHTKSLLQRDRDNWQMLKSLCHDYKPDLIYVFNLTHIFGFIPISALAEGLRAPTIHLVSDIEQLLFYDWDFKSIAQQSHWRLAGSQIGLVKTKFLKTFLLPAFKRRGFPLQPAKNDQPILTQFVSQYLQEVALALQGRRSNSSRIVHWGIQIGRYPYREKVNCPKRLLYVGQVARHKGVHTAIHAIGKVIAFGQKGITLTIVGGSSDPAYGHYLRHLISSLGLERSVQLADFTPREELPRLYQEHDIFIFPSMWDEPFSIALLEALSSGLAVVGTATGGTPEVLQGEANSLLFQREDSQECARQIQRLLEDAALFERIRKNGRHTAEERFLFEDALDKIEGHFHQIARPHSTGAA